MRWIVWLKDRDGVLRRLPVLARGGREAAYKARQLMPNMKIVGVRKVEA